MPSAGFYAVHSSEIRFGRDGCWYSDGERITNSRITSLFARHLERQADGSYMIRMADERARVEIEDTAFVVTAVQVDADHVQLELNDGAIEDLLPETLEVGDDDVLYCTVKNGEERVRFLRPAYHQLARSFVEAARGAIGLRVGDRVYVIERRSA